ncbi:Lrp/AsnC family transcriptional regulator [Streptomyces europaeiscabiei]|uniref:Lrp/AsnC family transcriptional regulator n=1 Tax=Streptomyces europaeiscabiei TaxID=146819 RepID=A0ABU4NS59_9ACTN|nr:Lrp/AsnC family transcriptional regulator [Streptomyces europaeiscabiei]MDX2761384.1 Lrp/AsnC family transcriptional regulator [Streptomyces europaeiscabiei]MDX2767593.1 Lrp/AsnC family transcriptional regulator [Streptomyces europaeiscabiei]MDX3548441.1 Lrp/AsnC family transcriptional regulator [Streptomyces europaeiscabiei]MDX3552635.1 Lrp/AsnC family transcriptional regulator [Streptomyces europaeiscabiei]MDX3705910.1 Lrp/AsnC family transcriptional regulator [Streptomyces europaeiscabie
MDAPQTGPVTDSLDRRIISALQIDGRAAWHRIAAALGEPERTVARRGTRLLEAGLVRIGAMAMRGRSVVVGVRCTPGRARVTATALARRPDCVFAHVLTGTPDCLAELRWPRERLAGLVLDELAGLPGVVETRTLPVLRHVRTIREWHAGLLTEAEMTALKCEDPSDTASPPVTDPLPTGGASPELSRVDRLLLHALAEDGRRTYDELARVSGVSEATARRRLGALRREGKVRIRAVIEPTVLGLPVEAVLRARTPPAKVDSVTTALAESAHVRYTSVVTGERQLLILTAFPDETALHDFVTRSPWLREVASIDVALVLTTLKRGGLLAPWLQD